MFSTISTYLEIKPPSFCKASACSRSPANVFSVKKFTKNPNFQHHYLLYGIGNTRSNFSVSTRSCSHGGQGETFAAKTQSAASDVETSRVDSSSSNDGYVALFIRMLGLDNDPLDREQAVVALWKYSIGGNHCIDNIMKYGGGTVNLIVNLLKSDSNSACEAAAGLLRVISSINLYIDIVSAQSGAIQELTTLLTRSSLSSDVKEQTICTLCNLSVDEKISTRITCSEIFPLLIKYLEDEDLKVKEAAGRVLANLTLCQSNHTTMVEAGVVPKLAKLLTSDVEESKIIRKVARNALLELAKDDYNRILIMEEGLVLVPLIGPSAYNSFRPCLYSWPSLPDGTKIEHNSKVPSRYGASELLLGLNVENKNVDLEEAKMKALVGRSQQQFLARIGAIEVEDDDKFNSVDRPFGQKFTILPWIDGVARLVLILGLEDESAIARAVGSVADASINEHMRVSFKEAGAIKLLVELINHHAETVRFDVIRALDRLSISNNVCHTIEAEGVLDPLVNLLKQSKAEVSCSLTSMILDILTRILHSNKKLKLKLSNRPVVKERWDVTRHRTSTNENDMASSEVSSSMRTTAEGELVDTAFIACLVDISKSPNTDLQRKAASLLESILAIEACD